MHSAPCAHAWQEKQEGRILQPDAALIVTASGAKGREKSQVRAVAVRGLQCGLLPGLCVAIAVVVFFVPFNGDAQRPEEVDVAVGKGTGVGCTFAWLPGGSFLF